MFLLLHLRNGKSLLMMPNVLRMAPAEEYGPKYLLPSLIRRRVTYTLGHSSPRVTLMRG
jgi:hypothetical protein